MPKYQGGKLLTPLAVDYADILALSAPPKTTTSGTRSSTIKEPDPAYMDFAKLFDDYRETYGVTSTTDAMLDYFYDEGGEFLDALEQEYEAGLLTPRMYKKKAGRMMMGTGKLLRHLGATGREITEFIEKTVEAQGQEGATRDTSIIPYLQNAAISQDLFDQAAKIYGYTSGTPGYTQGPIAVYNSQSAPTTGKKTTDGDTVETQPKERTAVGKVLQGASKVLKGMFEKGGNKSANFVHNRNIKADAVTGDVYFKFEETFLDPEGNRVLGTVEGTGETVTFQDFIDASNQGGYTREELITADFFGNYKEDVLDTGKREGVTNKFDRYINAVVLPNVENYFNQLNKNGFNVSAKINKRTQLADGIIISDASGEKEELVLPMPRKFFGGLSKSVPAFALKKFKNKMIEKINEYIDQEDPLAVYNFPDGRRVIAEKSVIDGASRRAPVKVTKSATTTEGSPGKTTTEMSSDGSNNQGQQPEQGDQPEGQKGQVSDGVLDDDEVDDAEKEVDIDGDDDDRMFMGDEEPNTTKTKFFTTDRGLTKDVLGSVGDNYMAKMDDEIKNIVLNIVDQGFLFDAKGNVISRKDIKPIRMGDYVTYGYLQDPSKIYQVKDRIEEYLGSLSDGELHNVFHHMGGRSMRAVDWNDTMAKDYLQYGSKNADSVIHLPRFKHLKDKNGGDMKIKVEDLHIKDWGVIGSLTPVLSPRQKDIARSFVRDHIYSSMNIKQEIKTYKDDRDSSKDKTDPVEEVTFVQEPVVTNMRNVVTSLVGQVGAETVEESRASNIYEPARTITDITERLAPYKANGYKFGKMNLIHTITLPEELYTQLNKKFGTINGINDKPMEVRNLNVFMIPGQGGQKDQFVMVFGGQVSLEKIRKQSGVIIAGDEYESVATETPVEDTYSYIIGDTVAAYTFNALKDVEQFREAVDPTDYDAGANFTEKTFFTLQNIRNK